MATFAEVGQRDPLDVDYVTLAELRYQIRRFLRVRELAAHTAGVEPQQYLLLLQIKALQGRTRATIGTLAERLQVQHHAAVQLVNRLVRQGMVAKHRNGDDRRGVDVELKPLGERILRRLAGHSIAELETEGPKLLSSLTHLIGSNGRATARGPVARWEPGAVTRRRRAHLVVDRRFRGR